MRVLSVKATSTNDTKLVIFNDSNFAQVIVPKGSYRVELSYRDMADFSPHHQIELTDAESYLKINATPTSNQAEIVPTLPPNFDKKFKPIR